MARLSGLQREVLSLYRKCMREIRKKPVVGAPAYQFWLHRGVTLIDSLTCRNQDPTSRTMPGMSRSFPTTLGAPRLRRPRAEFHKHLSVNKKDFGAIEYLLRKGRRQLETYASPGIRDIR